MIALQDLVQWIRPHQALAQTLAVASVVFFVGSLVVFPIIVAQLPVDYFVRDRRAPAHRRRRHPLPWAALVVVKNAVGLSLIVAGIAMLVLPGQGILTILVGLALTNFPGKFTLERRLFARPSVHRALNRIRELAGKPPLAVSDTDD